MTKISSEMNKAMNEQIKHEMQSAYLYLGMSYWFADKGLPNLASWFKGQASEEFVHAEKFVKFIMETDGTVELSALEKPKDDWESIKQILDETLKHEEFVTSTIHKLYALMEEKKEYIARSLLNWFVEEQVEEEDTARELIQRYDHFKGNDYLFDHHVSRGE